MRFGDELLEIWDEVKGWCCGVEVGGVEFLEKRVSCSVARLSIGVEKRCWWLEDEMLHVLTYAAVEHAGNTRQMMALFGIARAVLSFSLSAWTCKSSTKII